MNYNSICACLVWIGVLLVAPGQPARADQQNPAHAEEQGHKHSEDHSQVHQDHEGHDHEGHSHDEEHHETHQNSVVELTAAKIKSADVEVVEVKQQPLSEEINAPGEVITNAYRSSKATPRISAQVTKRYKKLGNKVKKGEPLVTLSSVEMARAQSEFLVAGREWQRVRRLGKQVVSERNYEEAQVAYRLAYAKVLAYGMTERQIEKLLKNSDPREATGSFELLAPQEGIIISDDFIVGEVISPGRILFDITDESLLWVEARLPPKQARDVEVGAIAKVLVDGFQMEGRVVQAHHRIDESTRTFPVRIAVANNDEKLHPGMFVDVRIQSRAKASVLAVDQNAVLRNAEGHWVVYVELEPGIYRSREIEVLRSVDGYSVIDGIEPGAHVVTRGAFFLHSEAAKSGFDIHQH
jgi:cobalt-zinc-cadmium efflux system membrane fusion protein